MTPQPKFKVGDVVRFTPYFTLRRNSTFIITKVYEYTKTIPPYTYEIKDNVDYTFHYEWEDNLLLNDPPREPNRFRSLDEEWMQL